LSGQSATTTFTRTITVADGVFAPGHLGELTQYLPFELVDDVLEQTRAVQHRLRQLPSRVGVYFVLALGLFAGLGYARVWDKLVAGLHGLPLPAPSEKALRDLRRRLGPAPLKALFEVTAGPLAQPATPGVRYRRWRTVAFDGCSSIEAPDQPRIRALLGKIRRTRGGLEGYPHLRLMALCETGTRGLLGAVFGPTSTGETIYARRLLPLLNPSMLLLADRAFDGSGFLTAVGDTGAQMLIRLKSTRCPVIWATLPDGSFLTRIDGRTFRIIDADVTVMCADGHRIRDRYRLATTLLDHRADPATRLVHLYHERWEVESSFLALRHTLFAGRVLRSADPFGLEQELWAQLALYQTLRRAMVDAVESAPGTDPDRAGFTVALQATRDQVITAGGIIPATAVPRAEAISRAVLNNLLPPRRARLSARKVKCPVSRYPVEQNEKRPARSQNIVAIAIDVLARAASRTSPQLPETTDARSGTSRWDRALQLLRTEPDRSWRPTELAAALEISHYRSFCAQLGQWTKEGILQRLGRGRYTLAAELIAPTPSQAPQQPDELKFPPWA
jgi:transposase IS4-like protein/DDE family transposase